LTTTTLDIEDDSPAAIAWQREQDAEAEQELRSLPPFAAFRALLDKAVLGATAYPPRRAGGRWFQQLRLNPSDDQPVVVVRDTPSSEPRVLVDAAALGAEQGRPLSVMWLEPSPDGRVLAFALMVAGNEQVEISLLDVGTGERLPDVVPWNAPFAVSWLPDSSGFYGADQTTVEGRTVSSVHRYVLGRPASTQDEGAPTDLQFPVPLVSPDGRHVVLRTGNSEPHTAYVRTDDGPWQPFLKDVPGAHQGRFHGDDFIALVDDRHPRGRVVRIPLATAADASTWTELVPESDDVLRWVEVVDGRLVLGLLRDATSVVRVLDLAGEVLVELPVSGRGAIDVFASGATHIGLIPMFFASDGIVSSTLSTPTSSCSLWTYEVATGELQEVAAPDVVLEGLVVRQVWATSSDGVPVPATLLHRADLDPTTTHPTLVHAYGGYGVGQLPAYRGAYGAFAEAGGVFALAHTRGGSEGGADWWRGGRRDRKTQVFDDVVAVAEKLVAEGVTTPAQLCLEGGSNGGTMAGAVLTRRPDLFAAVVSHVPQLDLLGMVKDAVGYAIAQVEYGDPLVPEEAEWLRAYSPRHNIRPGTAYPAVLVASGENDPRCPAWHARVFVAELRAATTSERPVLLRVHRDQGHGPSDRSRALDQMAEWLAFVAHHTGLEP